MRLPQSAFSFLADEEPLSDPLDRSRRVFSRQSLAGSAGAPSTCASRADRPRRLFRRRAWRVPAGARSPLPKTPRRRVAWSDPHRSPFPSSLRRKRRCSSGPGHIPAGRPVPLRAAERRFLPVCPFAPPCSANRTRCSEQQSVVRRLIIANNDHRQSDEFPRASARRERRTLLSRASDSTPSASASGD